MARTFRTLAVLLALPLLLATGQPQLGPEEEVNRPKSPPDPEPGPALELSPRASERLDRLRSSGTMRVAISAEQSIYEEQPDGSIVGVHYELVLQLAELMMIDVEFVPVEFGEFFELNGVVPPELQTDPEFVYVPDLLQACEFYAVAMSPLPRRDLFLDFVPLYPSRLVYVTRRDRPRVSPDAFADSTFATIPNTTYEQWMRDRFDMSSTRVLEKRTGLALLEAVSDGTADATVADANLVLAQLARFPELDVYPAGGPIETLSWATREDDPIAEILTVCLDIIRERGVFESIWQDYYGSPLTDYLRILSAS